jgi:hypothetical protein
MLPLNFEFSTEHLILTIPNMAIFDLENMPEEIVLSKADIFYKNYNYNLRIYKTKNGYRIFLTNKKFGVFKDKKILIKYCKELSADTRYIIALNMYLLNSFNARISPKYLSKLNVSYDINTFFKKYEEYQNKKECITTYIKSVGDGEILTEFQSFINEHDLFTKSFNKNCTLV